MEAALALQLKARPNLCLFEGWGSRPTYLYVDECSAGNPPKLSFRSEHNPGLQRDHSVLTGVSLPLVPLPPSLSLSDSVCAVLTDAHGGRCMDADGMSANLQLYKCLADDDDQQ